MLVCDRIYCANLYKMLLIDSFLILFERIKLGKYF